MDAFDTGHLYVRGGGWTGDVSCEARRLREAGKIFRKRLDNLTGTQNTQMEIRQQGDYATALFQTMMQNDGSGIGDGRRSRGDHASAMLDLVVRKVGVQFPHR